VDAPNDAGAAREMKASTAEHVLLDARLGICDRKLMADIFEEVSTRPFRARSKLLFAYGDSTVHVAKNPGFAIKNRDLILIFKRLKTIEESAAKTHENSPCTPK